MNRHNATYHIEINNNCVQINGNDNNTTINNNNIETQNNNNIRTQNNTTINIENAIITDQIIHPYTHYNIIDLTLFEQYCILTSKYSPYTSILDHLNLNPDKSEYHNMYFPNLHKNIIKVHTGNEWEKELISIAMEKIIISQKMVIKTLFNRFRIFLNTKAMKLIPNAVYYGCTENYYFYKKLSQHVKFHLYKKRNNKTKMTGNIPSDPEHEIFWVISKNFTWDEVEKLISKLDKYNIDLNQNLDDTNDQIIDVVNKNSKLGIIFKKIIKRVDTLIDDFRSSEDPESSDTISSGSG